MGELLTLVSKLTKEKFEDNMMIIDTLLLDSRKRLQTARAGYDKVQAARDAAVAQRMVAQTLEKELTAQSQLLYAAFQKELRAFNESVERWSKEENA